MRLLQGKNAIVTGAHRGIGKSIVKAFLENGANVWACVRNEDLNYEQEIELIAKENDQWIKFLYFDLKDQDSIVKEFKNIIGQKIPIDILVNNAGVTINRLFQLTTVQAFKEQYEVNVFSPYLISQLVARRMTKQKSGSIIFMSSSEAEDANPGHIAYASSKAAVSCMAKVMAAELGGFGIRVNAIAPGITETSMAFQHMSEDVINETISRTCLKKIGHPEDVANMALFLASEMSSHVTGQILRVDGGM